MQICVHLVVLYHHVHLVLSTFLSQQTLGEVVSTLVVAKLRQTQTFKVGSEYIVTILIYYNYN